MCEGMPYLPSPWESHTYSPHQPSKHDDSLAISHLGARPNRPNQSTIQVSYLDISGHWILYKVGWSHLPKEGYRSNYCQFHLRAHNLQVRYSLQDCYDNGTPFVNKDVRKLLDHRHIKHCKSTPYYPQGNSQVETTNRVLLRILSKMVHEYEGGWTEHLLETL